MSLIASDENNFDYDEVLEQLNKYLRLRATPIGMKMFKTKEEMEAIPRIRRPKDVHTTDQIVGQACRNGWTVGITMDDLVGAQCGTVIGLHPRNEEWLSGDRMTGVWYGTPEDAKAHQDAMDVLEYGQYEAMAVSPLGSGRLNPPDICLIYATPAQMILFINGLQWKQASQVFPFLVLLSAAMAVLWMMNCLSLCHQATCRKLWQGLLRCLTMVFDIL